MNSRRLIVAPDAQTSNGSNLGEHLVSGRLMSALGDSRTNYPGPKSNFVRFGPIADTVATIGVSAMCQKRTFQGNKLFCREVLSA